MEITISKITGEIFLFDNIYMDDEKLSIAILFDREEPIYRIRHVNEETVDFPLVKALKLLVHIAKQSQDMDIAEISDMLFREKFLQGMEEREIWE